MLERAAPDCDQVPRSSTPYGLVADQEGAAIRAHLPRTLYALDENTLLEVSAMADIQGYARKDSALRQCKKKKGAQR